ncbi:MAG: hypothetical protein J6K61_05120 [Clostridia bacterium]|nr:hypothetical protein [Clostridia bacterium]
MKRFWKSKWIACPIACLLSLLVVGRFYMNGPAKTPTQAEVIVKAEQIDNPLALALWEEIQGASRASLYSSEGSLSALSLSPSVIQERDSAFSSSLCSDISVSLSLPLSLRDGCFYAEGSYLAVGQTVTLIGQSFVLEGRILQISPS